MQLNDIMLSSKFNKSLPEGRREHTLRKLKHFFTVYADSENKGIHTSARPMEIRGVPGVYKLRTSRGERVLYEINPNGNVILREYSPHDDQITRAKRMGKNESGDMSFPSLFDSPSEENEFDQYKVEPTDELPLVMEQTEIIIATDEWIAQCEDTEDYIWLASAEQAEIISSNRYPQFISGSAGTGKTTVLFQKLCGMAQSKGDILYITISRTLKEDFQRVYEKFKPKQETARITFLTIDELYKLLLPGHRKAAAQEQFLAELGSLCQKKNVNPQDVWCEIEGIIKSHLGLTDQTTISFLEQLVNSDATTLSSQHYCDVKPKYSYFPVEVRDKIYEIAALYDMWLTEQGLADINQLAAEIIRLDTKKKYDLIIIDEVQDFTELQLYTLMMLAKAPTRMIFCGDINQNVRPTFFMFERLYNIYYSLGCKNAKENMYTLTKNYRSCKEIVVLLNRILDEQGRRIGFQGAKEDEGIHEVGFRDGHSPLVIESTNENLNNILEAIFDKHYAIAVTPDEQTRDALATLFPEAEGRIFTVQEAKGLEYDVVFTINITSAYEREWRKILYEKNVKRQRRLRRFFGYIYVAASRARNHLVIAEEQNSPFLDMISGTHEILEAWDLARVGLAAQSTANDFDRDARKLEQAGLADKAQAARDMAEKLRERAEEPDALPAAEKAIAKPYTPLGSLTKKLTLIEQDNKQGIVNDKGTVVVPCEYDSIASSTYKEESGKAVFECRRDGKVIYLDQNGDVFRPRATKPVKYKKPKRKKNIASVAIVASIAVAVLSLIFTAAYFGNRPYEAKGIDPIVPHAPIADFLEGTVIQVAAGHTHSAALMDDGTVWTWGDNLFDGGTAEYRVYDVGFDTNLLEGIEALEGLKELQGKYTLTATYETNDPAIKKVDIDNVIYVAAGKNITAAIKEDGSLWTWGYNEYGALGNGIDFITPDVEFEIDSTPYKILEDVKRVSLGDKWGMAVKNDGTLWAWGNNDSGVLGNRTKVGGHSCVPIKMMDNVFMASAGAYHGLALKKDGTVWIWGNNENGRLGFAKVLKLALEPQKIHEDAVNITTGYQHSTVTKNDDSMWAWGDITDGMVTRIVSEGISEEIKKPNDDNSWVLLFFNDGSLYTWAPRYDILYPIADSVVQASRFSDHLLVLKEDGSVWAWGSNSYSQLGDGTTEKRDELVLIYPGN